MIRRIGAAAGAVLASLAFAASAQAAPSTPYLKPISPILCTTSVTASWTPSTPDAGGQIVTYRLDIGDLTTGTATWKYANGLSTQITGLSWGHKYVVRVRALQLKSGVLSYSAPSGRVFQIACLPLAEIAREYVAYNPFPECIMCGRIDDLQIDDPVILRQVAVAVQPTAERFGGLALEADGNVLFR